MHWIDRILYVAGAVYAVTTVLAAVLPQHWRLTHVLARVATDLRGIRRPPALPPDEEVTPKDGPRA